MLFDEDYDVSDQEGGNVSDSTSENSKLEREVMEMFKQVGMYFSILQILLRPIRSSSLIYDIGSSK